MRQIKETCCFVAADLPTTQRLARETTTLEKSYLLPDGGRLSIGPERYEAAEVMFKPSMVGHDVSSLAELYYDSVKACPMDTRMTLYTNTVLSGGGTLLPGFSTRLKRDVKKIFVANDLRGDESRLETTSWRMNVDDPPMRGSFVWRGGAVLADMIKDDPVEWVSKHDYDEQGVARCVARFTTPDG